MDPQTVLHAAHNWTPGEISAAVVAIITAYFGLVEGARWKMRRARPTGDNADLLAKIQALEAITANATRDDDTRKTMWEHIDKNTAAVNRMRGELDAGLAMASLKAINDGGRTQP